MIGKLKTVVTHQVIAFLALAIILGVGINIVQARLVDDPDVILPPAAIDPVADQPTNTRQQAFDERQQVLLTSDVECTYGEALAGEVVNSHLIFYNTRFTSPEEDFDRLWEFEGEVICVMSERSGLKQGLTEGLLGAPGTVYPGPFKGRGMENDGSDSYVVDGNTITVSMTAEPTGDWIRVLTRSEQSADSTPPVVFCDAGVTPGGSERDNKGKGSEGGNFYELIGADETDGHVDIYLTDVETETVFGPFDPGAQVKLVQAKGALPTQEKGSGDVEYSIKVKGETTISATDVAGNIGEAVCVE